MNYISVSVMHSKQIVCATVLAVLIMLLPVNASCKVLDRIVAAIDDMAITKTEFDEKFAQLQKIDKDIGPLQALNTIINRELLLKDAQKYRIEGDENEVMRQYINLKFRALIRISDNDSEQYYDDHRDEFKGKTYIDVRNDIIKYLTEQQVNEKLKKQIEKLRRAAIIRIMLEDIE